MKLQLTLATAILLASAASQATLISSGGAEIRGTFNFDFETGAEIGLDPTGDVWWEQIDANTRQLNRALSAGGPTNAALIALGPINFAGITEADLLGYAYAAAPIAGPPASSALDLNGVFAVRTAEGNYAKAIVVGYDTGLFGLDFYDMHIRYELFDGKSVPEPASLALTGLALTACGVAARRRSRG